MGKELCLLICLEVVALDRRIVLLSTLLGLSLSLCSLLFCLSSLCVCLYLSFSICNCLLLCIVCRLIEVLGMILVGGNRSNVVLLCKSFSLSLSLLLSLASTLLLYVCLTVGKELCLLICLEILALGSGVVLLSDLSSLCLSLLSLSQCLFSLLLSLRLSLCLFLSLALSVVCRLIEFAIVIRIVLSDYIGKLLVTNGYTNRHEYGSRGLGYLSTRLFLSSCAPPIVSLSLSLSLSYVLSS